MKLLSLDRLSGPGNSVDENFELLCLDLTEIALDDQSTVHRNRSPDGGIDLYLVSPKCTLAYQCKAYSQYRPDLVRSVEKSALMASKASVKTPFDAYILMIPFVPTRDQRLKLEQALKKSGAKTDIVDGDQLERRLFDKPEIAARFLPSVTVVIPPNCEALELVTGKGKLLELHVESIRTGQRIRLRVSSGALVAGVVNFLVAVLRLPNRFSVDAASFFHSGELHWRLAVTRETKTIELSSDETLEEAGVRDNEAIHLVFEQEVQFRGGFLKLPGPHWEKRSIDSDIWDGNEMNEALTKDEFQGRSADYPIGTLIDRYSEWHFNRVRKGIIEA